LEQRVEVSEKRYNLRANRPRSAEAQITNSSEERKKKRKKKSIGKTTGMN
jgi:hypothetical protein